MPRYLGQHFLVNRAAIAKIISALDLQKDDTIVEIGPGGGVLTLPLWEKCRDLNCRIVAIEKDAELAAALGNKIKNARAEIVTGDALKLLPEIATPYKLVGNIPYYITGKLLRVLGEMPEKPRVIVLTIQREVAERLSAQPPKMNLLAAAVQIWAKPRIIGYLEPRDFEPPPDVQSAIIKLEIEPKIEGKPALDAYYRLVKILFKQPRKTVLNNLSTGLKISKNEALEVLKKAGLTGEERPQNLSVKVIHFLSLV